MRYFEQNHNAKIQFHICGTLINNQNFIHSKRCLKENVLILVKSGTLFINSNNHNYEVKENQFILLSSGEEHFGFKKSENNLSYYWIHFSSEDFISSNELNPNSFISIPEYGIISNFSRIHQLFRQLMDFSLDENFYNKEVLNYLTYVLLMEISNQFINNSQQINPIIFEITSWIKQNYSHPFVMEDLANALGYQSEYLATTFKKNMNKSLIQYTNFIRVEAAKALLPSFSVKETGYSCGFEDEKYFMKVFKKITGVTPKQYRKTYGGCIYSS